MLIDQLKIQHFRGVPESLKMNLSAPLTVIYAPNGTGKTSICDAVEWVLCGSVGRLSSLNKGDVKCRFGEGHLETFVEANIHYSNEPSSLKRVLTHSGSSLQRKVGSGDYKQVADQELLRLIVSAIPSKGNSAKGKLAWVRSTRFLENDSLSLLLDSDKESNDTRKLIFSNLFGVSEYQKAENDLNRILNKLPAASTITREKNKVSVKIFEYEVSIEKDIGEQGALYRDHATNLLNTIAENLGQVKKTEKGVDIQEYYKMLEVKHIQSNESLDEQKSSLLFIRTNFDSFQDDFSKSGIFDKSIEADNAALAILNGNLEKMVQVFKDKQVISNQREELIHEIPEVMNRLRVEKSTWNQLYELYKFPSLEVDDHQTRADKISEYVSLKEQKIAFFKEKVFSVEKQIKLIPAWLKKSEKLSGINIELEVLQARQPKGNNQEPLVEQVSKIKAELNTLQSSRENILGELELLLSSGKRYVETHTYDPECPLCEHKYESNQLLQKKINSRFSRLSNKSKEEAILVTKHEQLTHNLIQENTLLKQFKELAGLKGLLVKEIQEMEDGLVAAGITKPDMFQVTSISNRLENIREQYFVSIKEIAQDIAPYKSAYDAAKKLEEMFIRVKSLSSLWHQKLGLHEEGLFTIDSLEKRLNTLASLLDKQSTLLTQLYEDEKQEILKLSGELTKLEEEKDKKSADISVSKEKLIPIRTFLQDFKSKWSVISSVQDISASEIKEVTISIANNERTLKKVNSLFEKVEDYFHKIRESEKKENESDLYKKELKEAQELLQGWDHQEKARSVIEKEISSLQEEIRRFISQEIQPLSNIINTLYLRAQGNRFINSIEARPSKEGFLEWIAELNDEGESFDKMLSLSQGQRQDLALAIFLARARSLGGTFFMDEPLAHLDDLNRVALIDTLRLIVSEKRNSNPLRLVLTTASNNLLRHLREKFSLVEDENGQPALRIYKMSGNPKVGLDVEEPELVHSPNRIV